IDRQVREAIADGRSLYAVDAARTDRLPRRHRHPGPVRGVRGQLGRAGVEMTRREDLLMDERRLTGVHGLRRLISPNMDIVVVPSNDHSAAVTAIQRLCELWGGAKYLLVPGEDGVFNPGWVTA